MSSNQIHGYRIIKELTNDNSGFSKWGFVRRDRQEYFIKEFLSPIWPGNNCPLSLQQKLDKMADCNKWTEAKAQVYNAIRNAANGNIVFPLDFFREGSHYYLVTEKIDTSSIPLAAISRLPEEKLLIILRVFAHCLVQLEHVGVVHGDLKPDNFLVKETITGMYTLKLIDFDSSYLELYPPAPDDIQCDLTYMAPEVFLYMIGEEAKVGTKSDVFAAGIMFHQYLCGQLPSFSGEYDYIYEAALDGAEIQVSDAIPLKYRDIIIKMLAVDYDSRISAEELLRLLFFPQPQEQTEETPVETAVEAVVEEKTEQKGGMGGFYVPSTDDW